MIQLRRLFVLILFIICVSMIANADNNKGYKCVNNTYSSTGRVQSASTSQVNNVFSLIVIAKFNKK